MEKLRNSSSLKIICYIMIPILVAILILSIVHMMFLSEFGNKEEIEYSQTENFANQYLYFFINQIGRCQSTAKTKYFDKLEDEQGNLYCYFSEKNIHDTNTVIGNYINYLIIDRETGEKFTNIKSSDYQKVIQEMKNQEIYWNLVEGKIETNLTYINQDNIKYNYSFHHVNYDSITGEESKKWKDYDIYSFYEEEPGNRNSFLFNKNIYDFMLQHKTLPIYTCSLSLLLLVAIAFYLFWAIGYKKGSEKIELNTFDKIPYEIISIVCCNVILFVFAFIVNTFDIYVQAIVITVYIISYLIGYIACAVWGVTTIKRIKAKTFWKSFLSYKIINWLYKKINKYRKEISQKTPAIKKVFWYYWGFVFISVIAGCLLGSVLAIIGLLLFWIWIFYRIRKYIRNQEEIKEALEKIYRGNNDIYLDDTELEGILKEMAIYINDIAGGFSNAIEESLKSERLKTELITNVSHDIKTPLTSIINYVDLLKKEEIQDEKVKEYIDILDRKSQRLKKLTEDLVEASKVSSGNVQLNIEEIKLKELINQSMGEFKDRFEEKNLKIETNMPKEEIRIKADNRYLYRVIENVFSNVTKYALENSRVYIDMKKEEKDKIEMSIKNISKERLNISSEELMQRFVRGDKSRYTEGSGLGLSIAKSLTELQGGKFDIYIDGDLFKVVISF